MEEKRGFMKLLAKLIAVGVLLAAMSSALYAKDKDDDKTSDQVKRINAAANVLDEIMGAPDKGIPREVLEDAKCVAVVPSMIKGGFIVGARYGKGFATCRTGSGWSAPAPFTVTGGSWGLQIGGEAVDLVMLVMNDKGMEHMLSSKFKLGAEGSAAAGPVGRQAEANTDWKMRSEVLSYSRARGVFAGLELNGAVIKQDDDDTRILYGKEVPFKDILTGRTRAPEGSQRFLSAVRKYASEAKQERGAVETPKADATDPNR
jgi:lipid-binding SYLF domain-containing protein